jgi:polyvinyl alcohol dehydrogenase (cytochrome)
MPGTRHRHRQVGRLAVAVSTLLVLPLVGAAPAGSASGSAPGSWPVAGYDVANTRHSPDRSISDREARQLAVKWTYHTQGDVSATPTVAGGAVYFPDWGGYLHKVNTRSGRAIWSRPIADYTGRPGSLSRTSPTLWRGNLYIGEHNGGRLMAIDATTGELKWITEVDLQPYATITGAPVVAGGILLQGVSSYEAGAAEDPNFPCCTHRGSMTALDPKTGELLWRTYTVPDNGGVPGGYTGASIWGSPAVDLASRRVYVTTGNNHTMPREVSDCQAAGGSGDGCHWPGNHVDSILALDMDTGRIEWAYRTLEFDNHNNACFEGMPPDNCPPNPGPDADLGTGAQLFTVPDRHGSRLLVGAGQKNGRYWALDARTGEVVWRTQVAPGGDLGGIMWGAATDGGRIYVAATNYAGKPHQAPDGTTITTGSFAALDARTGRILWQIADPGGAMGLGPVSTANGVVYAGSTSGRMYALDADTGDVLFDHQGEGTSNAGPAIVDGTLYWGNGYLNIPVGIGASTTFYAFSIRGK